MTTCQRLRQSPPAWSPDYQAKAYHEKRKKTELKEKENHQNKSNNQGNIPLLQTIEFAQSTRKAL
jgi:hypothetical protein